MSVNLKRAFKVWDEFAKRCVIWTISSGLGFRDSKFELIGSMCEGFI